MLFPLHFGRPFCPSLSWINAVNKCWRKDVGHACLNAVFAFFYFLLWITALMTVYFYLTVWTSNLREHIQEQEECETWLNWKRGVRLVFRISSQFQNEEGSSCQIASQRVAVRRNCPDWLAPRIWPRIKACGSEYWTQYSKRSEKPTVKNHLTTFHTSYLATFGKDSY